MPLHYAAFYGNLEVVKLFVNAGADVNVKNWLNQTPLSGAMYSVVRRELIKRLKNSSLSK